MSVQKFDISLFLRAPILSSAQGGRRFGLDSAMQRDLDGHPAISGALVRGNLRHAWDELNKYALGVDVAAWLGKAAGEVNVPNRGRLSFSHWFSAAEKGVENAVRYRIAMDEQGKVERGALQVIEAPFTAGQTIEFKGAIWAELAAGEQPEAIARLIQKGLMWVSSLGAMKGAGFGKLESVTVKRAVEVNKAVHVPDEVATFGIKLTFDRPICFARPQIGKTEGNRFESEDFVPGAAMIAALALRWPADKKPLLDKIRITHAIPATDNNKRALAIPHALVIVDGAVHDMSDKTNGYLINGKAPAFCPDWKDKDFVAAAKLCGWPMLERVLETRTAIKAGSNTAEEGQLFSLESINTRDHAWLANVSLGRLDKDERKEVCAILDLLLGEGLWPLGKTDARATVETASAFDYALPVGKPDAIAEKIVVQFTTAAELLSAIPNVASIKSPEDWRVAYDKIFSAASDNSLSVERLFVREKLVGGGYLHKRFGGNGKYRARLLTDAGSVFVLSVKDSVKAKAKLAEWLAHGFPATAGDDWRTNPYCRQNGYGEIVLNPEFLSGDTK